MKKWTQQEEKTREETGGTDNPGLFLNQKKLRGALSEF